LTHIADRAGKSDEHCADASGASITSCCGYRRPANSIWLELARGTAAVFAFACGIAGRALLGA
jgi:hypothetical protein